MIAPADPGAQPASGDLSSGQNRLEIQGRRTFPVDSAAVTKEGLEPNVGGGLMDSLNFPSHGMGSSPLNAPSNALPNTDDEYRLADLEQETGSLAPPPVQRSEPLAQSWQPQSEPHIPSAQWTSASSNRTRQYLLIGFLGLSGIALAALLFVGFLRWYAADVSDQSLAIAPPPVLEHESNLGPLGQGSLENSIADSQPSNIEGPDEPVKIPSDLDTPNLTTDANPTTDSPASAQDAGASLGPTATSIPTAETPSEATSVSDAPSNNSATNTTVDTNLQLPKQLAPFAQVLSFEIQPQLPDAIEILSAAPVTAEDLGLTSSAGLPEIPAVDLTKQAQIPISALVVPALPISQFVSLWSNLTGIPTVADLDSLDAAAIDRNQKLELELVQSATVGSILPLLGQSLGLQAVPQEDRFLRLRASTDLIEQTLPSTISLTGLLDDEAGELWLTQTLGELLPDQSVSWTIVDHNLQRPVLTDGTPIDPLVWFSAVRLIEGWRMATGQPSTLSGYTATQLSCAFRDSAEVKGLEKVLTHIAPQSQPVSQVLPRICQEAGLHAWIDWANLGTVGLGPQTTAVFITSARPLRRVLADYASEFSFVVAVADANSLIITTNQAYRSTPQLYVIPNEGRTVDEWKSLLRSYTPAASGGAGVGSLVVVATPDGKYMLVRCCRPVVSF